MNIDTETLCNEETAKIMGSSLLKHAREIYRYALSYCAESPANEYMDDESRTVYRRNLDRMIKEMYALMLMARYKGVSRYCNREQVDAYVEAAYETIAPRPVVDYPALWN
ncbi:MAG: hypothetical protein LUE17_04675 [Planctomycetaceae bacterium]|nr:hypothetical protein [Planctomycetaceae bacterium]